MAESPLPEDATEPTSEDNLEEEEEDEEEELEGNEKQEEEKDENNADEDCKSSQMKPKKRKRKKKKKSDPKPATSVKKKISDQCASGSKVAKHESFTSQLSEAGSIPKVEDLDSDLDDATDASEDTGHMAILRETVKNLTQTVVQLSDENARLLKENKLLKKEIAKPPSAQCSSPKVVGDTSMIGALDIRMQSLEKAMKKLKASKVDASPASASSQMHQMKQQMLKLVQQSNAQIMSADKLKAVQQEEVERFDNAMNDLRQSIHAKDDAQKEELERFKTAMETFVKEKTKTLESSVKAIENLNVQAIETIKNIQEKADRGQATDVDSQTSSSTAFG